MKQPESITGEPPPDGGIQTLEIAASHLQVLLAAIAGSDGKIMFLTALNVAGISALVGIEVTANTPNWLVGFGLAVSGLCVLGGLGNLWTQYLQQFPTPEEALRFARDDRNGNNALAWRHFYAVLEAAENAQESLRRRSRLMRIMLFLTPIAFAVVIAAAFTTAR